MYNFCYLSYARSRETAFPAVAHARWISNPLHPLTAMIELRRARTIFNITLIGFVWKKKVIYSTPRMPWGWEKHGLIFILGWTNPLRSTSFSKITLTLHNSFGIMLCYFRSICNTCKQNQRSIIGPDSWTTFIIGWTRPLWGAEAVLLIHLL